MKTLIYYFLLILTSFAVVSCGSGKKTNESQHSSNAVQSVAPQASASSGVKTLSGYFLKNNYSLADDTNLLILKNKEAFDNALGIGKTMNNTIDSPDFENSLVMAVALKSTNIHTDLKVTKTELAGTILNVYATITKGEKQSFSSTPVVVFSVPENPEINQVQLFVNGEKIKSESLK